METKLKKLAVLLVILGLVGFVLNLLIDNPYTHRIVRAARQELAQSLDKLRQAVPRLTREQLWARGGPNQNSVGNLLLHLAGNVRQWIVCGLGGEEDRRDRPGEFAARGGAAADELLALLGKTVA